MLLLKNMILSEQMSRGPPAPSHSEGDLTAWCPKSQAGGGGWGRGPLVGIVFKNGFGKEHLVNAALCVLTGVGDGGGRERGDHVYL